VRAVSVLLLAGLLGLPAAAERTGADPFRAYLAAHPGTSEEDLLDVAPGDPLERVLAVVHHPDLGVDPVETSLHRIDGVALEPVPRGAEASADPLFLAVRQRCTREPEEGGTPRFTSWFLFRAGRLVAFCLQPFLPGCRRDEAQVEASQHEAMRQVGEAVFRGARVGEFHYGPLLYDEWHEAFAEPTPEAMLSRLESEATARPADAGAQNRLAVALWAVGERDRAIGLLERAAALAPAWSVPRRNLAVAWRQRGDAREAAAQRARAEALEAAERGPAAAPAGSAGPDDARRRGAERTPSG
jgi:hypothetical protein